MDITIIGSGTAVPSLSRSSPCVLVRSEETTIVCDTGPGALRQLLKAGVAVSTIDALCYSHLHIDHTADLAPLIFASNYDPDNPRIRDLTFIGPPGFKDFYDRLCAAYGQWIVPQRFSIAWHELRDGSLQCRDLTVTAAPVEHTASSIALRFEDRRGRSVVYSGDTGYCSSLVRLAERADLLILECSFPEQMPCEGHLTPSRAGRIAREASCSRLVLTHLYPACDAADLLSPLRREFSGELVIAEDLLTVQI